MVVLLDLANFNWFCCLSFTSDMVVYGRVGLSDCRVQSSKLSARFSLAANDYCGNTGGLLGNPQTGLLKI
jgi:hypothetical protein